MSSKIFSQALWRSPKQNKLVMTLAHFQQVKKFNRLRAIWPKGYQRGSLGKSHQNGD